MNVLAAAVFAVLISIAGLHAYWAFGGLWPGRTERELIDTVIGAAHMASMPLPVTTLAVSAFIVAAAFSALAASNLMSIGPGRAVRLVAAGVGFVFLARGVAGYFFGRVAWAPVEPFARLNLWVYSPLCLVLGASFFLLLITGDK